MKRKNFSVIELMVVIVVIMILIALVGPMIQKLLMNAKKAQSFNNLKNIVIAMQDYASSDTKKSRMPYPIAKGSGTMFSWGEDSGCWSPEIIKLLFKSHNLAKGNESILVSTGVTGGEYDAMLLSIDTDALTPNQWRWEADAELHFQVYCSKSLTNAASGNMVMGISYDQPDINNCLFKGEGWIVFMMDGSGGFKKRRLFVNYDFESATLNLVNGIGTTVGLTKVNDISGGGSVLRTVFGTGGNGGSTEIVGKKSTSAHYRAFLDE